MGEKCPIKFSHTIANSTVIVGFFYIPQSYDMGLTALLPLRRKAWWGFFRLWPGLNPRTWVPLDHQSRSSVSKTNNLKKNVAYLSEILQSYTRLRGHKFRPTAALPTELWKRTSKQQLLCHTLSTVCFLLPYLIHWPEICPASNLPLAGQKSECNFDSITCLEGRNGD
jgi:hypothetical protein